jgi:hypothetical protein
MLGVFAPATPTSGVAIRLADDTAHANVVERLRTENEPVQAIDEADRLRRRRS